MDRQDNMPAQGRRSASRATKLRRRKQRMNALLLIGAIAAILWLVFILPVWLGLPSPFAELTRAKRTVGTDSGDVESPSVYSDTYEGLKISEIMSSNQSSVKERDFHKLFEEENKETFENRSLEDLLGGYDDETLLSDREINLKGVGLSDDGTSVKFLFPAVTLVPDGRVVVFCDNQNQSNVNQPFHAKFKLSSLGETVYLYDPNSYLIDSCKYLIMASDESWTLTEDGSNVILEAEGRTLALMNEDAGIAATVNGTEVPVDSEDFDFREGHFISPEFLAKALGGEAVWREDVNTLTLTIPEAD